jgi:hypothetical protein
MYNKFLNSVNDIEIKTYYKNLADGLLDIEICEITEDCIRYKFGKNYSQELCECFNKEMIFHYINHKGYE